MGCPAWKQERDKAFESPAVPDLADSSKDDNSYLLIAFTRMIGAENEGNLPSGL